MKVNLPTNQINIFTGNYGSGKTEVAVNFAIMASQEDLPIAVADLDIVNPYFRSREVKSLLQQYGIQVIAPENDLHNSDLPIILPHIRATIENPNVVTILDVGGDPVGATVLASLKPAFEGKPYEMYFVLNQNRPFTSTIEGAVQLIHEIEQASTCKVTAIVSNTHLLDETTVEMISEGTQFAESVAHAVNVPLSYIVVPESLWDKVSQKNSLKYLKMKRTLLPPWKLGSPYSTSGPRDGFARLTKKNIT
ncbi:MAG: hypothetical protein N2450_05875 [bacterium]|nr:hypothetical protein [bacterium]